MSRDRFLKVLPILLFSGLFAVFLWRMHFTFTNSAQNLKWHGSWITSTSLEGDIFYFRKKLNVPENIKNGWVLVSATDELEVFLNGSKIGESSLHGWYPVGLYDVTGNLHPGTNVLGVRVTKRSIEGYPRAAVELGYEDIYGKVHYISSNDTWRVADVEGRNLSGSYWYDTEFNDAGWKVAEIVSKPGELWTELDPGILTNSPDGHWFWAGGEREISCRGKVRVREKPGTAWIRVASRGGFRLLVNGSQIGIQESMIGTENESMATASSPEGILRIYGIGAFLNRGENVILVNAYGEGSSRGLYIDGVIKGDDWSRSIDETDFECFYPGTHPGKQAALQIYEGNPGWLGVTKKELQEVYIPFSVVIPQYLVLGVIFVLTSLLFILLTRGLSAVVGMPFPSFSGAFLIPALFLTLIYILRYDAKFYGSFPFQNKFLIISLVLLALSWLLIPLINRSKRHFSPLAASILLVLILAAGAYLRFDGILTESLHPDESALVIKAQGVLDYGFPSVKIAPEVPVWYVSTSELVTYIQALSFVIFGKTEFALRLQMVLFGILTIPLIYIFGKMIGGTRLGLLASATFSLLPSAVGMASFGRYPSQLAFFVLLTVFFEYLYFKTDKKKYLYLCGISFLLSYFSWQGSALMLPALFLAALLFVEKKQRLISDGIIYLLIIMPPIGVHLLIRFLQTISLGNISFGPTVVGITPFPTILTPFYQPFFYMQNFFFAEGHQFISILFFVGIPFILIKYRTYKNLLFLYMVPLLTPFVMANLLEVNSFRYAYHVLPLLILCASGVLFTLLDYLGSYTKKGNLNLINSVLASVFFVFVSSGFMLNLTDFPGVTSNFKTNSTLRYFGDTEEATKFMKANMRPGDVVLAYQPHLLEFYMDKVDYFFESRLLLAVIIVERDSDFIVVHRVSGTPALISINEVKRIIGAGKGRVWLVGAPVNPAFLNAEAADYFEKYEKVAFESYNVRVSLLGGYN